MSDTVASTVRMNDLGFVVRTFQAEVLEGPDKGASARSIEGRLIIGTADDATLHLTDGTVSRYHVELEASDEGVVLRDLGSTNGTALGAVMLREGRLTESAVLKLGRTKVRLTLNGARTTLPLSTAVSYGAMLGASAAMRQVYATLARAAPTTAPVLVLGESGTGKELAARAVHQTSERAEKPFEVVDCGGLPPTLIESELFGHERGSFTGATSDREGAFERADGGTIFLDELGEMPLEVQPKLLRALGEGEVRRVGGRRSKKIDVRVVAATNRDLRREVNAGRFRADLYYRLAVIQVRMPALRERLDDLDVLVPALVKRICAERRVAVDVPIPDELTAMLAQHTWPGNVRELRNYLEQYVILEATPPFTADDADGGGDESGEGALVRGLEALPLRAAKAELTDRFERWYLSRLLADTRGNVAEAARRAGVDRGTVFRTMRRIGLREPDER
ncbi:MAG: sigma 54-dependent Fis family transcriptional regulator [Deltaproteobacteria bacterium]|nr:sigma 54-dependent Fis family transcriptional regulator [Myxococcales bacterium]MDP3215968.1 sigma 54-dependent Fis family transcriptional regulator [Deltaproteobacteria bacterium]